MLKLDLQLFAHKKGMGSTKNGRLFLQAISFTVREEHTFIRATTLVSARTTLFSLLLTAPLSLKEWVRTERWFLFILLSSNLRFIKIIPRNIPWDFLLFLFSYIYFIFKKLCLPKREGIEFKKITSFGQGCLKILLDFQGRALQ